MLNIEALINNPLYRIVIDIRPLNEKVVGFLIQDFSVSNQSDYNTPFEMTAAQQKFSQLIALGRMAMGAVTGKETAGVRMESFAQTVASWIGTQKPTFSLPFLLVSYNGRDIRKDINNLLRGIYPIAEGGKMVAPYRYGVTPKISRKGVSTYVQGTISVSIGKWFRARNQILRSVSFTYSKEVLESGIPLYANVEITFEPYRLPSADEIVSYFRSA